MAFVLELKNFQGPFDVLLEMLRKQKLDITEVALAKITSDYLKYTAQLDLKITEMNWFLYVAAKLAMDKSSALLDLDVTEESDDIDLEESLKRYAVVKASARQIGDRSLAPMLTSRSKPTRPARLAPITAAQLAKSFKEAMAQYRAKPEIQTIESRSDKYQYIRENFINSLNKLDSFTADEIVDNSSNKTEAIIYFLALLDMLRDGRLDIRNDIFMQGAN